MATNDGERSSGKSEAQVRLILSGLQGSAVAPRDWAQTGNVDYLYRAGAILVRDQDLDRVRAVLPGEIQAALVNGLTRYGPEVSTLDALDIVEEQLGIGVATPDHVLYVTTRTFCPATEPEEPTTKDPDPAVVRDSCDGAGVLVSVVDTGWLPDSAGEHDWLAGVDGDVESPLDAAGNIRSYAGHGTFAAGVVRAAAPACEVYVDGIMPFAGAWFESDIVRQLFDALRRAPDVISLQAGTTTRHDLELLGFDVLFRQLRRSHGTVLVAAAGNDGTRRPFWPAAFPWAVAVGALTKDGTARAPWSNFGPWVDVYARGEDHVNAFATGPFVTVEPPAGQVRHFEGMAQWSGTSFSTPLVAGCIAAQMSGCGVNAKHAWDRLHRRARRHAIPGVGPVLSRDLACEHGACDDCKDAGPN